MNAEIEKLKTELVKTQKLEADLKTQLAGMSSNRERLNQDLENSKRELKEGKVDFFKKLKTEPELETLQKSFDQLSAAFGSFDDDFAALSQAHRDTTQAVNKLVQQIHAAKVHFFRDLFDEEVLTIDKSVKEKIEKLWVFKLQIGGGHYETTLTTLFPRPDLDRIREIRNEIEKEYDLD